MTIARGPLRIVWFGSYSTGPGYPRSETLISGLRALGHDVVEIHAPLFEGAADRVGAGRGAGVARAAWRQTRAAMRLAGKWFAVGDHHVAVAGAGGVVDGPLLRFLQNLERRPLVVDAFIPLYDTVVRDRGLAEAGSLRARALLGVERFGGRVADLVLADTAANAELLAGDLGIARDKIAPVPISQPDPGAPLPLPPPSPLRVLLVATYIPLHGVDVVVEAARRLAGRGVELTIVGTGQTFDTIAPRATGVAGLTLIPRFEAPEAVAERLRASHVGLGIFGATEKAARVVPLKAALTLAHGRVLVTRESAAASEAFAVGDAVLVPPSDPGALADALAALRDNPERVAQLAVAGRSLYERRFSPRAVAESFLAALDCRELLP